MIRAYILVQTEVGASTSVTTALRDIEGVDSAEDVTGPYDVVAVVSAPTMQELGRGVIAKVQAVPRITRTTTCAVVEF